MEIGKELLAGEFFQDTGIVYYDGIWYLFTTTKIQPKEWRQELYFAKILKANTKSIQQILSRLHTKAVERPIRRKAFKHRKCTTSFGWPG